MLRNLAEDAKSDWKSSLAKVVHAYNCTRSEATGYAPYYLLYGRSPRLPVDIMFRLAPSEQNASHGDYASKWRKRMQEAYKLATETAQKEQSRAKAGYDRRAYGVELEPGSRVLVRNFKDRGGPGKLRSYWEENIYVVTERRHKESPVYTVRPERGPGKNRVLHRNLLLPCDFLPVEGVEEEKKLEKRKPNTDKRRRETEHLGEDDSSSEDEGSWRSILTQPAKSADNGGHQLRMEEEEVKPQTADGEPGQYEEVEPEVQTEDEAAEEQEILSDETDGVDSEPPSSLTRLYPLRQRNPPKTLTYDTLGQPSVRFRHK